MLIPWPLWPMLKHCRPDILARGHLSLLHRATRQTSYIHVHVMQCKSHVFCCIWWLREYTIKKLTAYNNPTPTPYWYYPDTLTPPWHHPDTTLTPPWHHPDTTLTPPWHHPDTTLTPWHIHVYNGENTTWIQTGKASNTCLLCYMIWLEVIGPMPWIESIAYS